MFEHILTVPSILGSTFFVSGKVYGYDTKTLKVFDDTWKDILEFPAYTSVFVFQNTISLFDPDKITLYSLPSLEILTQINIPNIPLESYDKHLRKVFFQNIEEKKMYSLDLVTHEITPSTDLMNPGDKIVGMTNDFVIATDDINYIYWFNDESDFSFYTEPDYEITNITYDENEIKVKSVFDHDEYNVEYYEENSTIISLKDGQSIESSSYPDITIDTFFGKRKISLREDGLLSEHLPFRSFRSTFHKYLIIQNYKETHIYLYEELEELYKIYKVFRTVESDTAKEILYIVFEHYLQKERRKHNKKIILNEVLEWFSDMDFYFTKT